MHDLHIVAADARHYEKRPKGYGVEVVPGAFTVWIQHGDPSVTITANLTGLSVGAESAPVWGGGIFVSGGGDSGGRLIVGRLETGAVFSDGGIALGTPDRISDGVFTVHGAVVDTVRNLGPVTTYGPNDMVLDNRGTVDSWLAEAKITSHGPASLCKSENCFPLWSFSDTADFGDLGEVASFTQPCTRFRTGRFRFADREKW